MVRVYDIRHLKDGTELIKDPLHLKSKQIKALEKQKLEVALDTEYLTQAELSVVYGLGERTGIPVVQRSYNIERCSYNGMVNYNDGEYIGDIHGFQSLLDTIFEGLLIGTQEEIEQQSLI